ncbi:MULTISPECIES: type II toxin-antitoxin system RelE/ParE family toxin [unclassified Avibacterium]|uniref:type II toxin-antitoxin system RelE/ParE family toxin n=1 Tax=unclassified Avibacterium TaxID=2685287 RepID=UPI002025E6C3|nr:MULTISPECIES: type II toxin-antitoxin system RelE/ParE family toxin [unclassified Avibacterium]MCW9698022.1 type II toxin-antitoxin system RelE/ParE family toxin [Avibacterium sp. 20-129]MCW9733859.1 type II toxin-antitoxin system RelE/ParE family toxin [Avibacterium sp. 20-15]URL03982.1 type II toxin-antitoxin system RelE/ParE family toxin [Avibacterium sp. 20-132]URL05654.1 type II toxin-antitoxin system RelE/ParE family toxin [Avibacterium sp. 21-595]
MKAVFIELPFFEKYRKEYLSDDEYLMLQNELLVAPEKGDLIQGTGGLRKLRIANSKRNRGKRGGARVIYYYYVRNAAIYFLTAYGKEMKEDLTADEKSILAKIVENIKGK